MFRRRIVALAAGAVLAASLIIAGTWTAGATTGTCTNIATPVSAPVGCGGIYLPLTGSGIQPNATSLTLSVSADFWNAGVNVAPYSAADASQDFMIYEVCSFTSGNAPIAPSPTGTVPGPCGTNGSPVTDPLSGFGEYVAEAAPLGAHLGGAINSAANLCLSVEAVNDGPHHAVRWHVVLRTCNTFGAHFTAGSPFVPTHGISGVVNLANHFQTWSPIPANGGYVLGNNALSANFHNRAYVLDKRGGGFSTGPVIAFPENDQVNEIWKVIGCTDPAVNLTPGFFSCP